MTSSLAWESQVSQLQNWSVQNICVHPRSLIPCIDVKYSWHTEFSVLPKCCNAPGLILWYSCTDADCFQSFFTFALSLCSSSWYSATVPRKDIFVASSLLFSFPYIFSIYFFIICIICLFTFTFIMLDMWTLLHGKVEKTRASFPWSCCN